jgi:hypothetical protein
MLRKVSNTVVSHEQNATTNYNMTGKGNESIESVVKFRYLGSAKINQNYSYEKNYE